VSERKPPYLQAVIARNEERTTKQSPYLQEIASVMLPRLQTPSLHGSCKDGTNGTGGQASQ